MINFPNTIELRDFLIRGGREDLLLVPSFDLDEDAYKLAYQDVMNQHGHYHSQEELNARAAYRVITSRRSEAVAQPINHKSALQAFWVKVLRFLGNDKYTTARSSVIWFWLRILWAILLLLGVWMPRAHAQNINKKTKKVVSVTALAPTPPAPKVDAVVNAPITVLPLDDATKSKLLKLMLDQSRMIVERRDAQIKMDTLDKSIAKISDDISAMAQTLAQENKIDTTELVLDLDKLAWVSKELKQ